MPPLQAALPAPYYVDEDHWSRERDQVLHREWFCAGRLSTYALDASTTGGRVAVVDVAGESVVVTRTGDGGLHAFYNVCRHRGSQLVPADPELPAPEPCAVGALRCPYHSWTYDLSGHLLRAPHTEDVDDFDPAVFSLHAVGVQAWGGFLWLQLTPSGSGDGLSLVEALGDVPARVQRYPLESLVVGRTLTYDVAANYKVVLENYNECYHCAGVHPELVRLVPSFGRGGTDLDWEGGIPHRGGAWTFTASGTLWPLSAARTRVVCDLLFAPGEVARERFDPSDAADFWDVVNRQDWAVCASLDIRRWLLPRLERA